MLCQFSVVGADSAHIRRLEVALRQAQTEKETLLTKLHRLEKQQVGQTRLRVKWHVIYDTWHMYMMLHGAFKFSFAIAYLHVHVVNTCRLVHYVYTLTITWHTHL